MEVEVIIALSVLFILIVVLFAFMYIRLSNLQSRVESLLRNSDNKSIEEALLDYYSKIDTIKQLATRLDNEIKDIHDFSKKQVSKVSLVKYNGFGDVGGDQSFVLCLLDNTNKGVLINSIHSRNTTRVYAKPVTGGEYEGSLSDEETRALSEAISRSAL